MNMYLYEYARLIDIDSHKSVKKLLSIRAYSIKEAANKGEQMARSLYPRTFLNTVECIIRYRIPGISVGDIL